MTTSGSATWALIDETRNLAGKYGSKWITATDASNNGWNVATGGAPVSLATLTGLSKSDILAALQASGGAHPMRAKVTFYGSGGGGGSGLFVGIGQCTNGLGGGGGGAGPIITFWNYDVSATMWAEPSGLRLGFGGAGGDAVGIPGGFYAGHGIAPGLPGASGGVSYYNSIFEYDAPTYNYILGGYGGAAGGTGSDGDGAGGDGGGTHPNMINPFHVVGNWVSPACTGMHVMPHGTITPPDAIGYIQGNPGQSAGGGGSWQTHTADGGVGAASGVVPNIYEGTQSPDGPDTAAHPNIAFLGPVPGVWDGPGAPKCAWHRWAAGGKGQISLQGNNGAGGVMPSGLPGDHATTPGGGGGGGGSTNGSCEGVIESTEATSGAGGNGGEAIMFIEWWL